MPPDGSGLRRVGPTVNEASAPDAEPARVPRRKARRRELPHGLPRWRRLRNTRDFARVERQGARAGNDLVAVTVRPGPGRLGFVVSKKVDKRAVGRNLVKRRLRAIMQTHKGLFLRQGAPSLDVVVTARPDALGASFATLQEATLQALGGAIAKADAAPRRPKR